MSTYEEAQVWAFDRACEAVEFMAADVRSGRDYIDALAEYASRITEAVDAAMEWVESCGCGNRRARGVVHVHEAPCYQQSLTSTTFPAARQDYILYNPSEASS